MCVCVCVPEREVHDAVEFLSGELGVGEPLEVDDENLRQRPEVQLLRGELVLLTHRTVPAHTRTHAHTHTHTHTHFISYLCVKVTYEGCCFTDSF